MSLSINTNVSALNAYRNLANTQNDLSRSLERLSSGLRINRAADDAAGLAISEGLRAQINGTKQAVLNAQNGISVVQTAEGALTETHSILQRMRTLSVQAANDGGLSTAAKQNIQDEITQLNTELTRIADTTQFNGAKLLNGNYSGVFQVGANTSAQDKITVDITTANGQGLSAEGLGIAGIDVTKLAQGDGSTVTGLTLDLSAATAPTGVAVNGRTLDLSGWNTAETADAVVANKALLDGQLQTALAGSGFSVTLELDDTALETVNLTFSSAKTDFADAAAVVTALGATGFAGTAAGDEAATVDVNGAIAAIDLIDAAITDVSSVRSQLGAVQNRFDHTINNLNVATENLSASESRIRDTDMAQEMVQFTRSQILSQAGTAMLAQAKNLPQSILQLLQ